MTDLKVVHFANAISGSDVTTSGMIQSPELPSAGQQFAPGELLDFEKSHDKEEPIDRRINAIKIDNFIIDFYYLKLYVDSLLIDCEFVWF